MNVIQIKDAVLKEMQVDYKDRDFNLIADAGLPPDWIQSLIPDFAGNEVVYNSDNKISMEKTMSVSSKETKAALVILYHWKRSDFQVAGTATHEDNVEYGVLTPLFMYAHKKYHDIPYEMWDKEDPYIGFALGKYLENAVEMQKKNPIENASITDIKKWRTSALTTKTTGIVSKNTAYKFNRVRDGKTVINASTGRILLQTWIANVQCRVENVMILDLNNWDSVPKAFDIKIEKEEESTKSKIENRVKKRVFDM